MLQVGSFQRQTGVTLCVTLAEKNHPEITKLRQDLCFNPIFWVKSIIKYVYEKYNICMFFATYSKQEAMENFVFPDEIVKNDWKFENIFPIP